MFEPENVLEHELVRAAHEPAHRDSFLRELLDQEVFLALLLRGGGRIEADPDGHAVIPDAAELEVGAVERPGGRAMPVFTSARRAQEFYREDHVIAPDRARSLFLRHPGTRFCFNPGSDYALDLSENEILSLLRGSLTAH